jgi:hypothetical protein
MHSAVTFRNGWPTISSGWELGFALLPLTLGDIESVTCGLHMRRPHISVNQSHRQCVWQSQLILAQSLGMNSGPSINLLS